MLNREKLRNQEGISSKKEGELKTCRICFRKHPPFECVNNFSSFPAEKKKDVFNNIMNSVERSGIGGIGESGMQRVLSQLSGENDMCQKLLDKLITVHGMGNFIQEKDRNGKVSEKFVGKKMLVNLPMSDQQEAIILNKEPIRFDKDFGRYVLRYNRVKADGQIDPIVRVNSLDMLASQKTSLEEEREFKKAA